MAACGMLLIAPVLAPTPAKADCEAQGWRYRATPYAWAISVGGTARIGSANVSLDESFSDLIQAADSMVAVQGYGEAHHGCVGVFLDGTYIKLDFSPHDLSGYDVTATNALGIIQGGGLLELVGSSADAKAGSFSLDALAGFRHVYQRIDLGANIGSSRSLDRSYAFTDGIGGLRGRYLLTENWELQAWGNVGAGGSNLSWEAGGGVGYRFEVAGWPLTAFGGYRALGYDYSGSNGNDIKQTLYGPLVGLGVRF